MPSPLDSRFRFRTGLVIALATLCLQPACGSFGRKVNQALPEFLRSDPGEDEIQRYQERVRVLNRTEADREAVRAAFDEAQALEAASEYDEAASSYEDFVENFPDSEFDEEARFGVVRMHRADEEAFETFRALKTFLKRYPISKFNKDVEELTHALATEYVDGEHDNILFGNSGNGVDLFREQIANFPNGVYASDAYWKMGNYFYDEGEYFDAAAAYDNLLEKYGDSKWASRALYNRALTRMTQIKGIEYDQQVMEQARRDFQNYLRDFPEADRREDAEIYVDRIENMICEKQISVADWYESEGFPGSARYVLIKAQREWGNTEAAKEIPGRLEGLPDDAGLDVILFGEDGLPSSQPATPKAGDVPVPVLPDPKIPTPVEDAVPTSRPGAGR